MGVPTSFLTFVTFVHPDRDFVEYVYDGIREGIEWALTMPVADVGVPPVI